MRCLLLATAHFVVKIAQGIPTAHDAAVHSKKSGSGVFQGRVVRKTRSKSPIFRAILLLYAPIL
jgi:hypothetical protein